MNADRDRQPPARWPWPGDTALQRARRLAVAYRQHLKAANPEVCAVLDEATRSYGEMWLVEGAVNVTPDQKVTTDEAAELAGVLPGTIHNWRRRGIVFPDGQKRLLATRGLNERGWPMFAAAEVRIRCRIPPRQAAPRQRSGVMDVDLGVAPSDPVNAGCDLIRVKD